MGDIFEQIKLYKICSEIFSKTKTRHSPRPVIRGKSTAKILIAGQAPGARVHKTGVPFSDPSGDVLRNWMGLNKDCLLYTSPSPRDRLLSRMPSSA